MEPILKNPLDAHGGKELHIQLEGEHELFFSGSTAEERCIGHLRFDVDTCGKLWSSWQPHQAAQKYNRQPFKDEFDAIMNALQRRMFNNPKQIMRVLLDMQIPVIDEERHYYGFRVDTEAYSYYLRIFPYPGDYSYCYCYVRGGEQTLEDTHR